MKARPQGKTIQAPMSGVQYRVHMSDKGHMIGHDMIGSPDPTFLCGRSVEAPQPWYDQSNAKLTYGEWYLIVDTRASGGCNVCATKYKAEVSKRTYDKQTEAKIMQLDSPISQEEWNAQLGNVWDGNERQFDLTVEWVAGLMGGTIIDEI